MSEEKKEETIQVEIEKPEKTETTVESTQPLELNLESDNYSYESYDLDFDNVDIYHTKSLFGSDFGSNSKKTKFQGEPFTVKNIEVRDEKTEEIIEKNVQVTICHPQLAKIFRNAGLKGEELYDEKPVVLASELITYLPQLKNLYSQYISNSNHELAHEVLAPIIKFLEKEYKWLTSRIESMVNEGVISYKQLWYIFQKGKKFYTTMEDELVGGEVSSTKYQSSLFSNQFVITAEILMANGRKFFSSQKTFAIPAFPGTKRIDSLACLPMKDDIYAKLVERGKLFEKIAIGNHYMNYKGTLFRKHWFYTTYYKADGRVMVDTISFQRMNPDYENQDRFNNEDDDLAVQTISKEKLYMTWPFIKGFSFAAKKWGEMSIKNMSPVQYDVEAFNRLVLPEDKKKLIRSLVENSEKTFSDVISGKGGGIIFLLHGAPGTGKTLTSEAIAEFLHRPLYSITVGELGTNIQDLEQNLREILEVATTWKSVILMDEADIFLEKRTEKDIKRNAMVGIFLRLLEYHQGILFLTTNRVKCFDEAFHSRISIAIRYDDLDEDSREKIWSNFFKFAGIEDLDKKEVLSELKKYELNGRQIKNLIRLSQSLAISENQKVSMEHLNRCINVTKQFDK